MRSIVAAVDHYVETVLDQRFGGLQRLRHVGEQRLLVAQDFQLDQLMAIEQFACKLQRVDRVLGVVAASGIGQDGVLRRRYHVEQAGCVRVLADVDATDCHCNDFRAAGFGRQAGLFEVTVLAAADQEAGAVGFAGNSQAGILDIRFVHKKIPLRTPSPS